MMRILLSLVSGIVCFYSFSVYAAGPPISSMTGGNKHNLSSLNTAASVVYKAIDNGDPRNRQICIFCHTPHHAGSPLVLWNRKDPTRTFGHYSSATLVIDDPDMRSKTMYGEPNGSARLCLSCHDGETALGAVANSPYAIAFPAAYSKLAMMNYSGHHPVSFVYDAQVRDVLNVRRPSEQFKLPDPAGRVKLDASSRMQCTACHDPHQGWSDDPALPFWVDDAHDKVCLSCHNIVQNP